MLLVELAVLSSAVPSLADPLSERGDQLLALNWGLGPVEISEQFPLASIHASFAPRSPEVLNPREFKFRTSFGWSNTINTKSDSYLVDSESRSFELSLAYSPFEDFQFELQQALVWRGAGVLDSPIFEWHDFFGLPQGARDDEGRENGEYFIVGLNEDGERFDFENRGVKFADLSISATHLLTRGNELFPALSVYGLLQLPTGADSYGQDSVDVVIGMLTSKRIGNWYLYLGGAGTYIGDNREQSIVYQRFRGSGFFYLEYLVPDIFGTSWTASFLTGLHGSSNLVENVSRFPNYLLYFDVACKLKSENLGTLEFLIRENPGPQDGTTDFTTLLAWSRDFDFSTN